MEDSRNSKGVAVLDLRGVPRCSGVKGAKAACPCCDFMGVYEEEVDIELSRFSSF